MSVNSNNTHHASADKPLRQKAHTALDEMDEEGRFQRTAAGFSHTIAPGTRFEPAAGRYHLYVSLACPWAAGTLAALKHKGLEHAIGVSVVHPTWRKTKPTEDDHCGWHFCAPGDPPVANALGHGSFDCDDACVPDTVNGCRTIRELYELANDVTGKYSTPVLWCTHEKTIVCNESLEILRILDGAFNEFAQHPERCLFPPDQLKAAEALNEYVYPHINNGVYRCGFATTQSAYEEAHRDLFGALDRLEAHAKRQHQRGLRYLTDTEDLTWIDLRVYQTLVRFDPVYVVYFKTSHKRLAHDYPNLLEFVRACYANPAIRGSTNLKHIKTHYFTSHPTLNTHGIIPVSDGPDLEFPREDDDEETNDEEPEHEEHTTENQENDAEPRGGGVIHAPEAFADEKKTDETAAVNAKPYQPTYYF